MNHQKVAVIVWTIDPEGKRRFLLRHNKPFNGYADEWTIAFGDIEGNENIETAAKRETMEEYSISDLEEVTNLDYKIEFEGKHGPTEVHFVALKVKNINTRVVLNEESIGYDWVTYEKAMEIMKHDDEKKVFDLI